MQKITFSFLTASLLASMAGMLYAQDTAVHFSGVLNYVESSNGLENPEWEGGRTELEFADINQDGNPDIITIGDHGNPLIQSGEKGVMVYFGDGDGNWNVQMAGDFGYGGIAAGDVNKDGFMDVGYAMHHNYSGTDFGDQLIEVALGNGTGTGWIPWDDGLATNGEDWGMFSTDFADVDNDGDLDLGSISFGCCAGIHVYLNQMNGTWTQSFGILEGNSDMIFQFGDIDNDGDMDFVAGYQMGTAYFGDGDGGFTVNDQNLPPAGLLGRFGPSLGDADGDGGMDLAFSNSSGGLFVYIFDEMQHSWIDFSGSLPASGIFEHTQLADMNRDGFIDLAAYGQGTFQLFLGNGAGNWTPDAAFTTGDPGYSQAFRVGGDVDHNGMPDIVILEEEGSWYNYQNHLRCYREDSEAFLLSIQPVFPYGRELLRPGSLRFIDWLSTVPGEDAAVVGLEYSVSGPAGPWTPIAGNLPDNGRYQWSVPQENSAECFIRYTISDNVSSYTRMTPAAFIITDGTAGTADAVSQSPALLVNPNPGREWLEVGTSHTAPRGSQLLKIVFTDLPGRIVKQFHNPGTLPCLLDISDLSPGWYIIRVIFEDGVSGSARFLKISG